MSDDKKQVSSQMARVNRCKAIGAEVGIHPDVVSGLLYMKYSEEDILQKFIRIIDVRTGVMGILEFAPVNEINRIDAARSELYEEWVAKRGEMDDYACDDSEWLNLEAQCKIISDQMKSLKDDLDSQHKLLAGQYKVSDLQLRTMRLEQQSKTDKDPKVIAKNPDEQRKKELEAAEAFKKLTNK